jgi:hypothetical protein
MKLMKSKKKGKITLSFTSPQKEFFIYIYDVNTWRKFKKRLTIHYLRYRAWRPLHANMSSLPGGLGRVEEELYYHRSRHRGDDLDSPLWNTVPNKLSKESRS